MLRLIFLYLQIMFAVCVVFGSIYNSVFEYVYVQYSKIDGAWGDVNILLLF